MRKGDYNVQCRNNATLEKTGKLVDFITSNLRLSTKHGFKGKYTNKLIFNNFLLVFDGSLLDFNIFVDHEKRCFLGGDYEKGHNILLSDISLKDV
jgi:hypothetical protein